MPASTVHYRQQEAVPFLDAHRLHRRRRQARFTLALQAIQEFVQRMSDEELLERSAVTARRAPFRMEATEEVIRIARRKKQS